MLLYKISIHWSIGEYKGVLIEILVSKEEEFCEGSLLSLIVSCVEHDGCCFQAQQKFQENLRQHYQSSRIRCNLPMFSEKRACVTKWTL
jgi:hypothetical protein